MRWLKYLRKYRRFERHSIKEVVLQKLLPDDWTRQVALEQVEHRVFDLAASELYDPARNRPHQRGRIQGFVVREGILWPAVGAIRTRDGALIEESFFDEDSRRFATEKGYVRTFPVVEASGAAATLGHVYRNFYHRFADSIPRIYALHHPAVRQLGPVRLYVDDRFTEDEMRIIRHLVPDDVDVVPVDAAVRVRAARCIHLPYMSSDRTGHSKWFNASLGFLPTEYLNWFRGAVYDVLEVHPPATPHRKLYVTRRNAKVRRLINEEDVAAHLEARGFDVVALEAYPLREQVRLFAEAEVVVAQHGAGLTNLLYAQAPRVLEIMSDKDRQIFFRLLSESRGFSHVQLHRDGADKNDDVYVPIGKLAERLASLGVKRFIPL